MGVRRGDSWALLFIGELIPAAGIRDTVRTRDKHSGGQAATPSAHPTPPPTTRPITTTSSPPTSPPPLTHTHTFLSCQRRGPGGTMPLIPLVSLEQNHSDPSSNPTGPPEISARTRRGRRSRGGPPLLLVTWGRVITSLLTLPPALIPLHKSLLFLPHQTAGTGLAGTSPAHLGS